MRALLQCIRVLLTNVLFARCARRIRSVHSTGETALRSNLSGVKGALTCAINVTAPFFKWKDV